MVCPCVAPQVNKNAYILRNTLSGCGNFQSRTSMYAPSSFPRPSRLARIYAVFCSLDRTSESHRCNSAFSHLKFPKGDNDMKKIIQDLSFAELEALVLALGEKKFRAKQLYDGLMQGKAITQISSLSKVFNNKDRFIIIFN